MRIAILKIFTLLSVVAVMGVLTTGCGEKKAEEAQAVVADSVGPPPPVTDTTKFITSPNSGQPGTISCPPSGTVKIDLSMWLVTFTTAVGSVRNDTLQPGPTINIVSIKAITGLGRFPGNQPTTGVADQPVTVEIVAGQTEEKH